MSKGNANFFSEIRKHKKEESYSEHMIHSSLFIEDYNLNNNTFNLKAGQSLKNFLTLKQVNSVTNDLALCNSNLTEIKPKYKGLKYMRYPLLRLFWLGLTYQRSDPS